MAFPTQSRLFIIWMRNLMISSLLMSIMYFSRDLKHTVRQIAVSMRDLDSESALDELRKTTVRPRVRDADIESKKILASGECFNPIQQNRLQDTNKNLILREKRQLEEQRNMSIPSKHSREFVKKRLSYPSEIPNRWTEKSLDEKTNARSDSLTWESAERTHRHYNNAHVDDNRSKTLSNSSEHEQIQCVYTIIIETGDQDGAGTESDISVRLSNRDGNVVIFKRLNNGHRIFEKGHTDTFDLADHPCISNICELTLFTDDYGDFSEWFVVRLRISVAVFHPPENRGELLQEKGWEINEWLPKEDEARELYTIRDDCERQEQPV